MGCSLVTANYNAATGVRSAACVASNLGPQEPLPSTALAWYSGQFSAEMVGGEFALWFGGHNSPPVMSDATLLNAVWPPDGIPQAMLFGANDDVGTVAQWISPGGKSMNYKVDDSGTRSPAYALSQFPRMTSTRARARSAGAARPPNVLLTPVNNVTEVLYFDGASSTTEMAVESSIFVEEGKGNKGEESGRGASPSRASAVASRWDGPTCWARRTQGWE